MSIQSIQPSGYPIGGGPPSFSNVPREAAAPRIATDSDLLHDLSNLEQAKSAPAQQRAAGTLITHVLSAFNPRGQMALLSAVESGNVKSKAQVNQLNKLLMANPAGNAPPGPIIIAIADALAQAGAAQAGGKLQRKAPASAFASGSPYSPNQNAIAAGA